LRFAQVVQPRSQCLLAGFATLGRETSRAFKTPRFEFSSGEIFSTVYVESSISRFLGPQAAH
jgi:hypothetical protein